MVPPSTFRPIALVSLVLAAWGSASCGGSDSEPPAAAEPAPVAQIFRGCVGQTGEPGVFLLTVSQGRDATAGAPAGTVVPQSPTQLPPGVPRPEPRVATEGLPGKGPDPIHRTESYRLVGSGGLELEAHVGHTIEVSGELDQPPQAQRPAGYREELFPELRVKTARHLAPECQP